MTYYDKPSTTNKLLQIAFWVFIANMSVVAIFLWGYNIGHLDVPQVSVDHRVDGMSEVGCGQIVRHADDKLYCEINLQTEDDNIKIFKGVGTYDGEK